MNSQIASKGASITVHYMYNIPIVEVWVHSAII